MNEARTGRTAREAAQRLRRQREAADELSRLVMARVGVTDRNELSCPREKSFMTPCVARDGGITVADDGDCVGCGARPSELLATEKEKRQ